MDIKKTISTIFIMPTLGIAREDMIGNNFINAYIGDEGHDADYTDCVYLLFKPKDLYRFRNFIDKEYERTGSVVDDYDYEKGYVVIVYKLNPAYKMDFNLIKEGKYSKTSPVFQQLFSRIVHITLPNGLRRDELSLQYRVFNKTKDLTDFWENEFNMNFDEEQEVWGGFIEEDETLTPNKIKEYVE
jgi:hypothetical protein